MEENILKKWSLLLDIPYANLIQPTQRDKQQKKQNESSQEKSLPNLVAIKISALDETFLYPARLIFISSSSKLSPTAMAGVNGLFGFNQGFTEDLGDKWHRWAWSEKISNYWEYACPRDTTTTTVLDTLSQENNNHSMTNLLQKAINEPVIASPLMATKSVATPGSATCQRNETNISMTPTSSVNEDDDPMTQSYQQPQHQLQQRSKARYQSGLSLVDFAMTHFAMPNNNMDDFPEYPELIHDNSTSTPTLHHPTIKMNENGQQHNQKMNHALINSNHIHANKSMLNISNDIVMNTSTTNTASNSTYQSPQIPNLELEAFGIVENMGVDNMVLDMPNQWAGDGMDDLDSFDFGVTEEDFDFFESGPAPVAPTTTLLTTVKSEHTFAENDLILNNLINPEESFNNFETNQLASLNEKQQQDILDTDMDDSHELSVTPLEVSLPSQHDHFTFQQQQEQLMIQKQHEHHQLFVPPQFAPVKMDFAVNDAKYINGGKFTYTPDLPKTKRRGSDYQPDYIPLVRKKKSERRKSSKLLQDTIQNDQKSLSIIEDAHGSTHSLSSTSVSSTEESSTEEEEEEEGYSENESEDEASRVSRTFKALCRAQNKFLAKFTSASPLISLKKKLSLEKMVMDYDSPFARTIASSVIRLDPKKYQDLCTNEDFQALDYLCQQVVMGGYPFSGGIESMSSNGFEANEGESAKVVVARRRNLLQKFNGGMKKKISILIFFFNWYLSFICFRVYQ